ncbi:SWIM zinc finger domain-containing protein [Streptomyces sp. NPDC096136]|uniref:SWIM zinc finger family protein n=1 Tax=Streptomyces sp. NPDC096136 TaxID=3366076 RepID=UPI0037F833D4
MTHTLGFTENDLRRLAGSRSFNGGLGYRSAVSRLDVGDGAITATVDGTDAYEVELTEDEDGGLTGWCDCPYGREGNFCKHCVAVGLTVLGQAGSVPRQRSAAASRTRLLDAWLESRTRGGNCSSWYGSSSPVTVSCAAAWSCARQPPRRTPASSASAS